MSPEDKIDPMLPYRGIRPLKEGNVFARYKIKKKPQIKREPKEEESSAKTEEGQHRIDIEA